ncbi:putative 2-dehydropantoate 2-reductase family [Phaeomoniella chlamydospora]|uniref:Putative 2-dehydropantoate 2-reductase family n=1 Tax=Phaeomoniella chlamydospora TaxID=158046 RepID=A0A0G2G8K5_PHACM|nr:putative 2-dehydropantoate 2-reductase family [Phaeomoniella chlamydospora]
MAAKSRVLLVGSGGIGTIAALNLETGGRAAVSAVLRSNFAAVEKRGFNIKSCDHGVVNGFKPTELLSSIPNVATGNISPFDYIVCTTKNIPDVPPTLAEIIKPAVTPGHSVVVLVQNGLNIERPILAAFPSNIVLSGVSFCGSHEINHGEIVHEDNDRLFVGAFRNPALDREKEVEAAEAFVQMYKAGGKCISEHQPDVGFTRWRKLLYNACLNPVCAITDLDTGRIQLAPGAVDGLVKPAMNEIRAAAKAMGHDLPEELIDFMITMDPITMYNPPSMQVDVRKVSLVFYHRFWFKL